MISYVVIHNVPIKINSFNINYYVKPNDSIDTGADMMINLDESMDVSALAIALASHVDDVIHGLEIYKDVNLTELLWSSDRDFKIASIAEHYNETTNGVILTKDMGLSLC